MLEFALLVMAQITKAPEFADAPKVQSAKPGVLETTSHVSAERAELHAGLLRQLEGLPGYEEGVRLIVKRLNGPAQDWFERRGLRLGVAVVLFLNGREDKSAEMLLGLAGLKVPPAGLIGVMGESVGVSRGLAPKMLEAMKKLARDGDAQSEYALGLAFLRQEEAQVEAGLKHLRAASQLDVKDTRALFEIAKQESQLGNRASAVEVLEELLKRDEKVAAAHYRLSQLYRGLRQNEKSASHMRRYQELIAGGK